MPNALALIRSLMVYGLCLPLAIALGYLLALPMDWTGFLIVLTAVLLPLVPILLRWHHFLLIASFNLAAVLFFLPGRPDVWIVMSCTSLLLSVLQHILNRENKFLSVPSVSRPLIFLALVVLATGALAGGIGIRSFGSAAYGAKRYVYILAAIVAYFAISCNRVPRGKEGLYVSVFLLSGMTSVIGSLGGYVDPKFNMIFAIFPVENLQMLLGDTADDLSFRLNGLGPAAAALIWYGLARHGLRGLIRLSEPWGFFPFRIHGGFQINQPWRAILVVMAFWLALHAGFRSSLLFFATMFVCYFFVERLHRSAALPVLVLAAVLAGAIVLPMASRLPAPVQRALSILPVDIDPVVRMGAEASTEWRMRIWQTVLPTVPRYLLVGKGYSINPAELAMTEAGAGADSAEAAMVAGDYHSGPLTLIIPLGIWGAIGFIWFLATGFRVLYRNYRYGNPELRQINTFLLLYFFVSLLFYFFVFGSFFSDLFKFTSLVALSISINSSVPETAPVRTAKLAIPPLRLARAGS